VQQSDGKLPEIKTMQEHTWEKEYRDPKLVTLGEEAIQAVKDWVRFLRREKGVDFSGLKILDLGCGNGKNSIYIAKQGTDTKIFGLNISKTAVTLAQKLAGSENISSEFIYGNIGTPLPFADSFFDIALDITSSNSLGESERDSYLKETSRVLKTGGHFFVRALSKDGDAHAKNLIKLHPGKEKDTYVMPELGLTERVFTKEDFLATYAPYFTITNLEKEVHYTQFGGRSYKRHFWVAWMVKK
jgi:ubiquinone/menaquinone biosynthesis C-methylase UbiE